MAGRVTSTEAPRVSAIVCAYTLARLGDLEAAVASLGRQTRPPDEIVVVIDHEPALLERAQAAFPDAIVLASDEERGLSGARNAGSRRATGDVLAS